MSKSSITAVALVLVMVASAFAVSTVDVAANKGTRDSFGYAWTDSKLPSPSVAFNWVEINSTGTLTGASGDDDWAGPYPIGFNFTFYGNRYTAFNVTTNGYIEFGGSSGSYSDTAIPSTGTPNNFVAVYWHDMYLGYGANQGIYYETVGSEPNRMLVVEFRNWSDLSSTSTWMNVEIILCENGDIWMQYLNLNGYDADDATIGIENSGGTVGCQYSSNTASLQDNLAIRYSLSPVTIGPSATLTGKPGTTLSFTLTVTNKMAAADSFAISTSGVEGWTTDVYDSSWNALTDTDFDLLPDTGTINAGASVTIHVNVTVADPFVNPIEYTTVNATAHSNASAYDTCVLTSQSSAAFFDPPHTDSPIDPDMNGEADTLELNATIYVRVPGWYYMWASLYSPSGWYIGQDYVYGNFAAGTHYVIFNWMGWLIHNMADDGQMRVDLLMRDNAWVTIDTDTHYTASYAASLFMPDPASLNPPHYASVVDTDADGLNEALVLHTNVTVVHDGRYRVWAYMYDDDGVYMLNNYSIVDLVAGTHTFDIWFDSEEMRKASAVGSPYEFWIYLTTYDDGAYWDLDTGSYITPAYNDSLFQAPDAYFQRPYSETPADVNSDGYYEWFYFDVGVNVTVAGYYTVSGDLYFWDLVDTDANYSYLDVGFHTVRLEFPGWPIRYNGDSHWPDVDITLTGDSGLLDTDSWSSSTYYYYYDFATAPGWFETTYECAVEDVNADGLYDFLDANVTVNVTADGVYEVHADLLNWFGGTICDLTERQFLTAGAHVINFQFPGWMIRADGYDPDEVYLYLYDEDGRQMDTYSFLTPVWAYTDFQSLPASFGANGNTIYPVDDGSDGVNDTMVMEVNVTVDTPGWYYVVGYLQDWWGTTVGAQRVHVNLPAGNDTVTIRFPGWLIHALAMNGTFWCNADLYDPGMNDIDSIGFSGGYQWNDFSGVPPGITSTWASDAPSIDGVIAPGEWTNATVVDMTNADSMNRVASKLLVMNNATFLFVAFDVYGDTSEDASDMTSIAFDTGNDEVATSGHEDEFDTYASGTQRHEVSNSIGGWWLDCSPFDDTIDNHTGLASASGFGTSPTFAYAHRIFEFSIPLALLNATMYDTLGFVTASHTLDSLTDAHNWTHSAWPLLASDSELDTYGNLVLATHVIIAPPVTTHGVSGTLGDNSWYVSNITVSLSATGGDGGVDHIDYSLDGGAWTVYTGAIAITTGGTHTMNYRATDAALQQESTKTVTFRIDMAKPVTTPGISGTHVWLNATDAHSGVSNVQYRIDGGSWTNYAGVFNVTGKKGDHLIEFRATDTAGNVEVTKSITVEVKSGTSGGVSGLLSNPILWIILIAAVVAVLLLVVLLMRRRKGQQPVMYPGPYQPMPQPNPEVPPPPGPPMG